jgi:hypothetical protein
MLLLSFLSCFHTYGEYQEMRAALLDQDGDGYIWDQFPEEGGDDRANASSVGGGSAVEEVTPGRDWGVLPVFSCWVGDSS